MNIIKPSSPMKVDLSERSELETECLFGEKVEIINNIDNNQDPESVFCKLLTDNYFGWIKKKDLGYFSTLTHRVISKRSFIYLEKNVKSNCIHYLPLGAQLSVFKIKDKWAEINLPHNDIQKTGYIPIQHIVKAESKVKDWVSIAEKLLGTPYKWGGRDTIGIDCSALLQLSYQTYGENIPRNTINQIALNKEKITNIHELNRGYVIFWEGHVGIMVDKLNCIHANAFHMETIIEPLNDIIFRFGEKNPIIKIMNFNKNS